MRTLSHKHRHVHEKHQHTQMSSYNVNEVARNSVQTSVAPFFVRGRSFGCSAVGKKRRIVPIYRVLVDWRPIFRFYEEKWWKRMCDIGRLRPWGVSRCRPLEWTRRFSHFHVRPPCVSLVFSVFLFRYHIRSLLYASGEVGRIINLSIFILV